MSLYAPAAVFGFLGGYVLGSVPALFGHRGPACPSCVCTPAVTCHGPASTSHQDVPAVNGTLIYWFGLAATLGGLVGAAVLCRRNFSVDRSFLQVQRGSGKQRELFTEPARRESSGSSAAAATSPEAEGARRRRLTPATKALLYN